MATRRPAPLSRPPAWFVIFAPHGDAALRTKLLEYEGKVRTWGPILGEHEELPPGFLARRRCIRCREAIGQHLAMSVVVSDPVRWLPPGSAPRDEPVLVVFWLCAELCLQRRSLHQDVLECLRKARPVLLPT